MSINISRKNFITSLGVLGAATVYKPSAATASEPKAVGQGGPLRCNAYLQNPTQSGITIRWLTAKPSYGWVAYGTRADVLDKLKHQSTDGLVNAGNTLHGIELSGLQPNTTYYYKVFSKEIVDFQAYKVTYGDTYSSEPASFKTLKTQNQSVEIIVLNDIHDRPQSFGHLLGHHNLQRTDFIFLNGDMFNFQTDEQQLISNLIDPINAAAPSVPFILSRGNHETRGGFARDIHKYFNGIGQNYYYAFQHGPVYIIVLDSGEDKTDDNAGYYGLVDFDAYRLQQAEWLKQEVRKKEFRKAKYKLVFSHIPLFYSGDWHGTMHCRQVWNDILNNAKIDMLVSGHTHSYGVHKAVPGEHNYPIVIGGGPQDKIRTSIKIVADDKALVLTAYDNNGKLLDTVTV